MTTPITVNEVCKWLDQIGGVTRDSCPALYLYPDGSGHVEVYGEGVEEVLTLALWENLYTLELFIKHADIRRLAADSGAPTRSLEAPSI